MEDKRQIAQEMIIIRTTPLEEMVASRDIALNNILTILDHHTNGKTHEILRKTILDNINRMHRADSDTMERLLNKLNGESSG